MGLAAFNRMRIRQIEKYKPENIKKAQEEVKPVEEKPKVEEIVKIEPKEEVKTTTRKTKAND